MAYYSPWVFEKGLVLFLQLKAMAAIEIIVYNSCGELPLTTGYPSFISQDFLCRKIWIHGEFCTCWKIYY